MMPAFVIILGGTLDNLGQPPEPGEVQSVRESVEPFIILFAIVGFISLVAGLFMVLFWSIAGERQARKRGCMRRAYVKGILRQDIAWFDANPAGQLPTAVTANMAKVQDGLGRKVADLILN
ncbi:unnamed protein product, partial [Discosporangium mesarthrocarpum]